MTLLGNGDYLGPVGQLLVPHKTGKHFYPLEIKHLIGFTGGDDADDAAADDDDDDVMWYIMVHESRMKKEKKVQLIKVNAKMKIRQSVS